jgi:hypothetical protein
MASPPPQPDAPAPNWTTQQEEILCPLCDYNLRGLNEPRCPECGYRFTWTELLDEARRRHPYLFEQPLRRPIWSFFRTVWGEAAPGWFWRSIHPALPVRPWRLLLYWALVLLPLLLSMGALAVSWVRSMLSFGKSNGLTQPPWTWIAQELVIHDLWPMLALCCWPALLLLTLMIFQISMRRARVRTVHVFRCITYSSDSLLLLNIPTLAIALLEYLLPGSPGSSYTGTLNAWVGWATLIWVLLTTWRLRQAYRHYLRFDHPLATVLVSQFIVFLVMVVLLLQLENGR